MKLVTVGGLSTLAVAVVVTVAGLDGCTDRGAGQTAKMATTGGSLLNCPPDKPVNITQISVSGKTATVTLHPDPRDYPHTGAGLHWSIKPMGYSFTADGIVIASPPAGAASASTGTEYQWCFGATTAGTNSKYTIKLYADDASGTVFVCDPTIISSADLQDTKDDDTDKSFTCTAP